MSVPCKNPSLSGYDNTLDSCGYKLGHMALVSLKVILTVLAEIHVVLDYYSTFLSMMRYAFSLTPFSRGAEY